MGRLVKCSVTGSCGDSNNFYKIGNKWFKDKETYIHYLTTKDITYQDILSLLTEDRNCVISNETKDKVIKVVLSDLIKTTKQM